MEYSDRRWQVLGAVWAAAAFAAPLNGVDLTDAVPLSDAALAVAVVVTVLWRTGGNRAPDWGPIASSSLGGVLLIGIGGVLGTLVAEDPEASLEQLARFLFATGGTMAGMALWRPSPADVRRLVVAWLLGALVCAAWALTGGPTQLGRPMGLTVHPNTLGLVCLLGAGLLFGVALDGEGRARQLATGAAVLLVTALLASGSRAALLGLIATVAVAVRLSHRRRPALRAGWVAGVLGVALVAGLLITAADAGLSRFWGDDTTAASDEARSERLARSIERIKEHPVTGEGFTHALEAHNVYLQALIAAGPLGLAGLVLVAVCVLRTAPRAGTDATGLAVGLVSGYAGYLVDSVFQNNIGEPYLWLLVSAAVYLRSTAPVRDSVLA